MPRVKAWLLATLLLANVLASSQAVADRITVRAWPHDDFLRVVFDWKNPVEYTAAVEGRVVTVRFSRPIESSLKSIEKNLGDQVVSAEIDQTGRTVRIVANQDFELRHFVLNGSVVTDLVSVAEANSATGENSQVTVRIGQHRDFTRLVFDWERLVPYAVEQSDGTVSVQFDQAVALDLSAVDETDRNILSAEAEDVADGTVVRFRVRTGAEVKHFRDGPRIALDVSSDRVDPQPGGAPAAAPVTAVKIGPVKEVPGVPTAVIASGEPTRIVPSLETEVARLGTSEVEDSEIPAVPTRAPSGPIVAVHFEPKGEGGVLRFSGSKANPAAVFSRGGWTWVVVDRDGAVNVARLQAEARGVLEDVQQIGDAAAIVLRFLTPPGVNPAAVVDGDDWLVDLAERPAHPLVVLSSAVRTQANRSQLFMQLEAGVAGRPIELADPEVGDNLLIVPVSRAGHGVAPAQRLVDLNVLMTTQGIALSPRRPHIGVSLAAGGLAVDAKAGASLYLTPEVDRQVLLNGQGDDLPRIFNFEAWGLGHEPDFNAAKTILQNALVSAPEDARDERRLALARFYFVRGFEERTLGALAAIERSNPGVVDLPEFVALRGASRLVAGDVEGASEDLNAIVLDGEPEIELWRAALLAKSGDPLSAAVGLQKGHSYASRYPEELQLMFALLGAQIGLEVGEPGSVRAWLDSLEGLEMGREFADLVSVFDARAKLLAGDGAGGLSSLNDTIAHGDRRSRAEAILARTEFLLEQGELTPEQAIEELESLRFVWRGDSFEFSVLRRLGELQIEKGAFQQGLQTLKRATSNFEEHPQVGEITAQMQDVFEKLFLEGNADDVAPVRAIALFNEFRELTPPGAPGDRMIRHLADRLAAVDLLDQAAGLLLHQIEFRITDSVEKAEVGARLAALRLLDRQPSSALEALDGTVAGGLPDALANERNMIRARAMAEVGEIDAAIALLSESLSEEAKRVRAGILWEIQDWSRAAEALAALVEPSEQLEDGAARDVLRLAIALALAGQAETLAGVRQDFGVAMLSTPYAIDFRIVTSNQGSVADIQSAINRVAAVDDFEAFMEQYRGRATAGVSTSEPALN